MTKPFSVPADWHHAFFTDPVMRFWDAAIPPQATEADVAFIMRHIAASPPASIADLPCGSRRCIRSELSALRHAGIQARHAVDALACMGNSIGYGEPAQTQKLLHRFSTALRTGGRLILDTGICAESLLPIAPERRLTFPGGWYEQEITYDTSASIINTRAHLTIDGNSHELLYRHFVMTSGELVRMLHAAALDVIALYGDTDDTEFVPGSPRLLIVAVNGQPGNRP